MAESRAEGGGLNKATDKGWDSRGPWLSPLVAALLWVLSGARSASSRRSVAA
jgi:hypothetical protein